MQDEIDAEGWPTETHILGVNSIVAEAGNETVCHGRSIPWLQDTEAQQVWQKWGVTERDVIILDAANRQVAVYNLTTYDLSQPANYDSLKALLHSFGE